MAAGFAPDQLDLFNATTFDCNTRAATCPTGQLAIVVDDVVQSAPAVQQPEFDGDTGLLIAGNFTEGSARELTLLLDQPLPVRLTVVRVEPG